MASGAGFMLDAMNNLKRNKGMRSKRSFLNGVGNEAKFVPLKTTSVRSRKEEAIFQKRMKTAKRNGMKKEVLMYAVSFVIVLFIIFLVNQFFF